MPNSPRNQVIKAAEFKADFFKALSNPTRIRIMNELRHEELTVSDLRDRLGIELPNASQQLAILKSKKIVTCRRDGINVFYSCSDPRVFKLLDV